METFEDSLIPAGLFAESSGTHPPVGSPVAVRTTRAQPLSAVVSSESLDDPERHPFEEPMPGSTVSALVTRSSSEIPLDTPVFYSQDPKGVPTVVGLSRETLGKSLYGALAVQRNAYKRVRLPG